MILDAPVDGAPLTFLRIAMGILYALYLLKVRVRRFRSYRHETVVLPFELTPFIYPPSYRVYQILYWVQIASNFCMGIGLLTFPSTLISFLLYTYFFLFDKLKGNNLYYLHALLLGYLCLIEFPPREGEVPYWQLFLFQFQIFVVYFYAGVNKLNRNFLLDARLTREVFTRHFGWCGAKARKWLAHPFAWGGALFDICAIPLLMLPPTKYIVLPFYLFFHLWNSAYLTIGIFPWLNLCFLALFFPEEVRSLLNWWESF